MSVLSLDRAVFALNKQGSCSNSGYKTLRTQKRKAFVLRRAAEQEEAQAEIPQVIPEPEPVPAVAAAPASQDLSIPEWMPEQGVSVLQFLGGTDFDLKTSTFYKEKLAKYMEAENFEKAVGFKQLPETIHGRLAMIGILTGVLARVFGAGSLLFQFGKFPAPVIIFVALITAASIIPGVKGADEAQIKTLLSENSIPEELFTESNERFHGRLAMIGLSVIFLVEAVTNGAFL
eukprot:TRINITY_DN1295_c0_g2_i3.p2 TRINITY_DN1295_c0_g2~~TRINITY_DN1295_c0_g2_i3.p2  ORF type:complete len:232 (+),score=47.70 TRINITY_DN1295_c0_g2_i3:190-885(+)